MDRYCFFVIAAVKLQKYTWMDFFQLTDIVQSAFSVQELAVKTLYFNYWKILRLLSIIVIYLQQDGILKYFGLAIILVSHH